MEIKRLDELTEELVDQLFDEGCLVHPYTASGEDMVYIVHPFAYDIVEE